MLRPLIYLSALALGATALLWAYLSDRYRR